MKSSKINQVQWTQIELNCDINESAIGFVKGGVVIAFKQT
jgi:hypothetical protein